jgi:hypothetical protein
MKKVKPPKYVRLKGTEMRLIGKRYYRDAGEWSISYKLVDGKWLSKSSYKSRRNDEFIPITFEEWKEGNGPYAPKHIKE